VAEPPVAISGVLRELRARAGLTQEELAEAAGLSPRAISDLERGVVAIPHKDIVRLLADALQLTGMARVEFETAARARIATRRADGGGIAATRALPRDIAVFTGRQRELAQLTQHACCVRARPVSRSREGRQARPPIAWIRDPRCAWRRRHGSGTSK
jgi:transcriptional regulator with XRE-family HTH domain